MRILVVEHHHKPSVGVIGETLHDLGFETVTVWCATGDSLPPCHAEHDGIVILGGTMTALDDDRCPYLPGLTRLIRDFADADKPVLGVCLGAQLIARAFDANIHIGGPLEFGFHVVTPTASATDDPVLRHLERPLSLFQWHTDHYELPPGAEQLATGENYENQAYRIGRAVYGMQFHFEVTEAQVQGQIDETPSLDDQIPGHREWLLDQFAAYEQDSNAFCRNVTRSWAELV